MPIESWDLLHQTKDVSYLLIERRQVKRYEKIYLNRVWEQLSDEYLSHFGVSEQQKEIFSHQRQIAKLKLKKIITGDQSIQTLIELKEKRFNQYHSDNIVVKGISLIRLKIYVEKMLGFSIDLKKTSVMEFNSYLIELKNG